MLNYSPQIPNDSRWELLEAINANRPHDVPPCGYFRGRMAEKNKSESLLSAPDLSPKSRPTGAGHENHQKQTVRLLPNNSLTTFLYTRLQSRPLVTERKKGQCVYQTRAARTKTASNHRPHT